MRCALAFLILVGCGSSTGPAGPKQPAPSCDQVAAHLVELALADNQAPALPDDARGLESPIADTCEREAWSPDRRRCLAAAPDQDATLGCAP